MTLTKNEMHLWFMYLFEQRMDDNGFIKCFECGKKMHEDTWKEYSSCYSHILAKSKSNYPEYAGEEWNVKICHPDCHNLYTQKPQLAVNQYKLYLELLEKHKNKEL